MKQANIDNRFSYARTNVLVKDHKASFYKSGIPSVYQVEYNLQPKGNLSIMSLSVFSLKYLSQTSPIVDVQILYAKTGKCVIIKYFTPYKVRLTAYALIHERHHDKYVRL